MQKLEARKEFSWVSRLELARAYLWQRTASILSWGQFTTRLACPTLRLSIRTHNILGSQCRCLLKPVHDHTVPPHTLPWGHLTFCVFRTAVFTITAANSLKIQNVKLNVIYNHRECFRTQAKNKLIFLSKILILQLIYNCLINIEDITVALVSLQQPPCKTTQSMQLSLRLKTKDNDVFLELVECWKYNKTHLTVYHTFMA